MLTLARRLFWLAVLGGVGYATYTAWQRRNEPIPDGPAEWPPFDVAPAPAPAEPTSPEPTSPAPASPAPADDAASTEERAPWVEPTDGTCPIGYPIKGNANSGIYHVPGGRFYDRTVPERCYATEEAAAADGYRRAKA